MAKASRFSRDQLEEQIELIRENWTAWGEDDALEAVERYIRRLYASLPGELREPTRGVLDAQVLTVDFVELEQLLYAALNPAFDEAAVVKELEQFRTELLAAGGESTDRGVAVRRGVLREIYELRFDPSLFSDELLAKLTVVSDWLDI